MSAYVAGTVFGGFLGRFLTGLMAAQGNWRGAFVLLGILDLLGALAVRQWLPPAVSFVPGKHLFKSFADTWGHLQNPRLLAVCGMGFTVLFSLVGAFTYVTFYLARSPFGLSSAALGGIFFVYLLGCVVTPFAENSWTGTDFARTAFLSVGMSIGGLWLTLLPSLPAVIVGLGGVFLRHFHFAIGGDGVDGARGRARPLCRRGALRDLRLRRRQRGHGGDGVVLGAGRLGRVRGPALGGERGHARIQFSWRAPGGTLTGRPGGGHGDLTWEFHGHGSADSRFQHAR